jgi:polyribonucleotide 5'-hydroxyl-kinase
MLRRFSAAAPPITVLKLDKSGGCADRDEAFMSALRQSQIREYFFGTPRHTLSPHTQTVDFGAVTIYRIAEDSAMLSSFLPGGEEETERPVMQRVEPSAQMLHCVMAVVYAGTHDAVETIRDASVVGFVYVAEVEEKKRRLRVLAPLGGKIGDRPLVWGSWPEPAVSLI